MTEIVKKKRRRRKGLGLSIKDFAAAIDAPVSQARKMVEAGDVKVINIGDLERIPLSEAETAARRARRRGRLTEAPA